MTSQIDSKFLKWFFMLSAFKKEKGVITWTHSEHRTLTRTDQWHYDVGIHRKIRLTLISFLVCATQKKYAELFSSQR